MSIPDSLSHTPSSPLDLDRAARALANCGVGHTLDFHPRVESTMILAHSLALRPDIRSGAVVLAEEQNAGRGRLQRRWEAPPGRALLLSILLRRAQLPADPGHLPVLAGLAVLRAVQQVAHPERAGLRVGLKWPNDVLLGPSIEGARKMAGILIESSLQATGLQHAVVGIGINVNQSAAELPLVEPPALPPTSLAASLGVEVDRTEMLIALCEALAGLLRQPAPLLIAEWKRHLWTLGRPVTVHAGDAPPLEGMAVDVTESGRLIVEESGSGQRHVVDAGDVSLRGAAAPRGSAT